MTDWISVKEQGPEESPRALLVWYQTRHPFPFYGYTSGYGLACFVNNKYMVTFSDCNDEGRKKPQTHAITYWMPLPEPPEAE